MKKIGMLVAVEIGAVLRRYGDVSEKIDCKGFDVLKCVMKDCELYVLKSGAGQIAAAAGVQLLIDRFGVDFIVNFGVVGGLTEEMTVTKACVVESVVHYEFDTSPIDGCEVGRYLNYPQVNLPLNEKLIALAEKVDPELKRVVCASGDKFVAAAEEKKRLHKQFGADIVEMEAAAIVLTCDRNEIPCVLIKSVSDSITGGAEEFSKEIDRAADVALQIVDAILASGAAE